MPERVDVLAPEMEQEDEQPHTTTKGKGEQPKPKGQEEVDDVAQGEDDSESSDSGSLVDNTLTLLSVFEDNLKHGRSIYKHFVQARISQKPILKGVDADAAVKYLTTKKTATLSGAEKTKNWLKSNCKEVNTLTASSLGGGRLFTPFQTMIIEEAFSSLPHNASGQQCLDAILADSVCRGQSIGTNFTKQQLKEKVRTIRRKPAREAKLFR